MVPLWMKKMRAPNSVRKTSTKFCSGVPKLSQLNQKEGAPHLPRYGSSKLVFDNIVLYVLGKRKGQTENSFKNVCSSYIKMCYLGSLVSC